MIAQLVTSQRKTDRQMRELGRQIGGLGNKFGSFTEGLAYESCRRILREDFGLDTISHGLLVRSATGENEEYDLLGVSHPERNEVMVVEIKSHLTPECLEQLRRKCCDLPKYLPEYQGRKIHGLFAAVHVPRRLDEAVARAGFYLATGADENFHLRPPPKGFRPATF